MNDRKWYPAPRTQPVPIIPPRKPGEPAAVTQPVPIIRPTLPDPSIDFLSWVNVASDEDAREREAHARLVERAKLPTVTERIVKLHGDVLLERRMLRREASRSTPRAGVVESVNERLAVYEAELDNVLDALVYHSENWAHLPESCLICRQDVRL